MTDAAGRTLTVVDASRIVSIGGAVTEILYALGLEDRVVAVDSTSTFPARTAAKPNVGYMRQLSAEGVLAVNPSLVLAVEGSGPKNTIEVLESASIPFLLVPEAHDAATMARKIRFVAEAAGVADAGDRLASTVLADLAEFETARAKIPVRRKAAFVLAMGNGAPMVAGDNTLASAMFALAGVDNALGGFSGYKPANEEATMAADADAVVIMSERRQDLTPEIVFAAPAFAGTPAARSRRLVVLPGSYLLGFGPRIAHAARDLAAGVYPELDFPPLPDRPWTGYEQAPASP
jgi:iron complex transport system substrate-binding protein